MKIHRMVTRMVPLVVVLVTLAAPGTASAQVYDPLEPVNRVIFNINDTLDRVVLRPVAEG